MNQIESIQLGGLKGFSSLQQVDVAQSTGEEGSGLTLIVGANNSGKSTVLEALAVFARSNTTTFSDGKRNAPYGDRVEITLRDTLGNVRKLESTSAATSQTAFTQETSGTLPRVFVVPSRRSFNPLFYRYGQKSRAEYASDDAPATKSASLDTFGSRLFKIHDDPVSRANFDELLAQVISPLPAWTIDQSDEGRYFMKFRWGVGHKHNSEGLGEGLISLMFIIDSLYDSEPGELVAIDEPELSLHPQLQRKLRKLLSKMAADRQVVIATHSPYLIDWDDLDRGARLVRVVKDFKLGSQVFSARPSTVSAMAKLASDANNPHVLGLDASEVFFLEDGIVLVEGQEDVVIWRRVLPDLGSQLHGDFFGWAVGGAAKMKTVVTLLEELGYERVVGVLDGDQTTVCSELSISFPNYKFETIPADDIRTKAARTKRDEIPGLTNTGGKVLEEHVPAIKRLLAGVNTYLDPAPSPDVDPVEATESAF